MGLPAAMILLSRTHLAYALSVASVLLSILVILVSHDVYLSGVAAEAVFVYDKDCLACYQTQGELGRFLENSGYRIYSCISGSAGECQYYYNLLMGIEGTVKAQPIVVVYKAGGNVRGVVYNPQPSPSFWMMLRDTSGGEGLVSLYYRSDFIGLLELKGCVGEFFKGLLYYAKNGEPSLNSAGNSCSNDDFRVVGIS